MLYSATTGGEDIGGRNLVSGASVLSLQESDQERHCGGVCVDHLALGWHRVILRVTKQWGLGSEHGLETPETS